MKTKIALAFIFILIAAVCVGGDEVWLYWAHEPTDTLLTHDEVRSYSQRDGVTVQDKLNELEARLDRIEQKLTPQYDFTVPALPFDPSDTWWNNITIHTIPCNTAVGY